MVERKKKTPAEKVNEEFGIFGKGKGKEEKLKTGNGDNEKKESIGLGGKGTNGVIIPEIVKPERGETSIRTTEPAITFYVPTNENGGNNESNRNSKDKKKEMADRIVKIMKQNIPRGIALIITVLLATIISAITNIHHGATIGILIIGLYLIWEIYQAIQKKRKDIDKKEKKSEEEHEKLREMYLEFEKISSTKVKEKGENKDKEEKDIDKEIEETLKKINVQHKELREKDGEIFQARSKLVRNYLELIGVTIGMIYLSILFQIIGAEGRLGLFSQIMIWSLIFGIAIYIGISIKKVEAEEVGLKIFLGLPYKETKMGPIIILKGIIAFYKQRSTWHYLNISEDGVMMTGKESQPVKTDFSVRWRIRHLYDVITTIGMNKKEIEEFLEGSLEQKGKAGLIRDRVAEITRAFIAGLNKLDEVLKSRAEIRETLKNTLIATLGYHGIECEVVTPDIDPSDDMTQARSDRAKAPVEFETAKYTRKTEVQEKSAKVDVIKYLMEEIPATKGIVPLIAAMMLGDEAIEKLMAGAGKLNIYLAPALQDLFSALKGGHPPAVDKATQKVLSMLGENPEEKIKEILELAETAKMFIDKGGKK